MFQEKRNKKKKFKKNSIPLSVQHSYRGRQLWCSLSGIEMFQGKKRKIFFFFKFQKNFNPTEAAT
jgi:hypothetical protein